MILQIVAIIKHCQEKHYGNRKSPTKVKQDQDTDSPAFFSWVSTRYCWRFIGEMEDKERPASIEVLEIFNIILSLITGILERCFLDKKIHYYSWSA